MQHSRWNAFLGCLGCGGIVAALVIIAVLFYRPAADFAGGVVERGVAWANDLRDTNEQNDNVGREVVGDADTKTEASEEVVDAYAEEFVPPQDPDDPNYVNSATNLNGGWPMHDTMRAQVRYPGDVARFYVRLDIDAENLVLLRAVADDTLTEAWYFPFGGEPVNILPLLEMGWVTSATIPSMSANQLAYLESRGVNVTDGEILQQNLKAVLIGEHVDAGSYFIFDVMDDEALQVNRGMLFAFSTDSDAYTVTLDGDLVEHPTFVLADASTQ